MNTTPPVAIVTGAGSGIGRATALLLGQAGYQLAMVARTEAKLQETAAALPAGARSEIIAADVSDPGQVQRIVERTLERWGRIDALVNVAGAAPNLPIAQVTPAIWRSCIDTNLSAIVLLTAACWPTFRGQNGGVIVNVSSMASLDPFPGFAIYAAAKAGVNLFTRCTAEEGKAIHLRAVTIAPGAVETPMLRSVFDEKMISRDRTLAPEEIANVIRDCVTGQRPFESGQVIVINNR
jgi:3-oxoacyl-[acyl-carrier protein] reductase